MGRWLSKNEREAREAEKAERKFNRRREHFKKLIRGAVVSFDETGRVCFLYPNGQIFKCRGPLSESIFGCAPEVKK